MKKVKKVVTMGSNEVQSYLDQAGELYINPWKLIAEDIFREFTDIRSIPEKDPDIGGDFACAEIFCEWPDPEENSINRRVLDKVPSAERIAGYLEDGKRIHAESGGVYAEWSPQNEALYKAYVGGGTISVTRYYVEEDTEGNLSALEDMLQELDLNSNWFDPVYDSENEKYILNEQRIEALKWAIAKLKKIKH